jgi:hypothetical protein
MPFTLRWQLEIAFEAMALQYERLCESARYRPDAYLFAVALAQVVKAAEITDGALGSVETERTRPGDRYRFRPSFRLFVPLSATTPRRARSSRSAGTA